MSKKRSQYYKPTKYDKVFSIGRRIEVGLKFCWICLQGIERNDYVMRGNVCFECEVEYNVLLATTKKSVYIMGRKKDWYRAARGSGHYPLTFNFVFIRNDKYVQCSYCGAFIHEKRLTRDHVYPKSKGGLIKTPACMECNMAKEDKLPIEWALHSYKLGTDLAVIPIGSDLNVEEEI